MRRTRKAVPLLLALVLGLGPLAVAPSCYTLTHTVGGGPAGQEEGSARQWYLLFGLLSLNSVDSERLAGNATSYRVTTEWSFLDIVLNLFTGLVTVTSRTVTVQK